MFDSQDRNPLSSKDKFGTPRLQSGRNLIAVLGPLFGVFHGEMPDNVSVAHFVGFLECYVMWHVPANAHATADTGSVA